MFDLTRFHTAQDNSWGGYDTALKEMKQGYKTSHWIWYIFPQLAGMGKSEMSRYYGIAGLAEAKAYAADPVLIGRLREITGVVLEQQEQSVKILMGSPIDVRKLQSCMTLFEIADPGYDGYAGVLEKYYLGRRDFNTLRLLYPSQK